MTTPNRIIKIVTASDEASVIDLEVLTFSADPVARWM
jgi:hypothetical protein